MKASLKKIFAATLFVKDLKKSKEFYLDVFDVKDLFEDETCVVFGFENMFVNLTAITSAHTLVEPAQVALADAPTRSLLAFEVDDVDAVCAELAERGIPLLNGPINRPWGMRTASFTDPDGHIWVIAEDLDPGETTA